MVIVKHTDYKATDYKQHREKNRKLFRIFIKKPE